MFQLTSVKHVVVAGSRSIYFYYAGLLSLFFALFLTRGIDNNLKMYSINNNMKS